MVSLGGISLGSSSSMQKGIKDDIEGSSFYHVHWYVSSNLLA
ncbi:hypothetical protein RAMDARK_1168 [Rickettsia amblyommatis str. Darkwater]|nr:hypothetical protein RAMDARK_1168 [Rickettsia amblyommatis str. Darkwater]